MRHHKTVKKLDRNRAGRKALYRALLISFFQYGRIRTTQAKAKALRPIVERLITKARRPSAATERYLFDRLQHKPSVSRLLDQIAPSYQQRPGGYTRIIKLTPRRGDGARLAVIELVK